MAEHLPSLPWLKLHFSPSKASPIWSQIFWEAVTLQREIDAHGCDICLNVDAGTFCRFTPSVTMSRDMLSFRKRRP